MKNKSSQGMSFRISCNRQKNLRIIKIFPTENFLDKKIKINTPNLELDFLFFYDYFPLLRGISIVLKSLSKEEINYKR